MLCQSGVLNNRIKDYCLMLCQNGVLFGSPGIHLRYSLTNSGWKS